MTGEALKLAEWIRERYPYPVLDQLTHLKLQKLAFYCFGAALAFDLGPEIGPSIVFEAWKHGPVNRDVWNQYRQHRAAPIPPPVANAGTHYSPEAERVLTDVLKVYGVLDAWSLREQSHLEQPWIDAREQEHATLDNNGIRTHFKRTLRGDRVLYPAYLADAGSFFLDGIPVHGHRSLHDLASVVHRIVVRE